MTTQVQVGTAGNDVLQGSSSDSILIGNDGSDRLIGDSGNDLLISGDQVGNEFGSTSIEDLTNSLRLDPGIFGSLDALASEQNAAINNSTFQGGSDSETFTIAPEGTQAVFSRVDPNPATQPISTTDQFQINGAAGDDRLSIADLSGTSLQRATFLAGAGNDVLDASQVAIPIVARGDEGDDQLTTGKSDDTVAGGLGNDVIVGGAGKDTLIGGLGDDRFTWNPGDGTDVIRGNAGTDTSITNGSQDAEILTLTQSGSSAILERLSQTPFEMNLTSTEGIEFNGAAGNDILALSDLSETDVQLLKFSGGEGDDILIGSGTDRALQANGDQGSDFLIGGSGENRFNGGIGDDRLVAGSGNNQFVFESEQPFSTESLSTDTLIGFKPGMDKIVLDSTTFTALENPSGSGVSPEFFGTVNDDTAAAQSDAFIVYSGSSGKLFYNPNGAEGGFGDGNQFATLIGNPQLSANDFVMQA